MIKDYPSHKKLTVWEKSMRFVNSIYEATENLPTDEKYGLVSQIRRAAVSIPTNITEGYYRNHLKEYVQFLYIANGSASEVGTLLEITNNLKYLNQLTYEKLQNQLIEILKMINKLIHQLKKIQ